MRANTRRSDAGSGRLFSRLGALATLVGALLLALPQAAPAARPGEVRKAIERLVFSPELVMAHQKRIGLSAEQRESFIREMQRTQADLVPVQIDLSEAAADLAALLEGPAVDEEEALVAARRVMDLEAQVKERHMALMIRIKNLLTAEQQQRLRRLREGSE